MFERWAGGVGVAQVVARTRFGVSLGIAQVEVFTCASAQSAVLEAERVAQVAAGLLPADATVRPTRLSELLVTGSTDRAGVHAVLRDVAAAQAQLHALQAAAISRLGELQPAQQSLPGARAGDPADAGRVDDWVADEVAVVVGVGIGSASVLVDRARVLFEELPQVWAAAADGEIDVRRCGVLVDALAHRKRSAGGGLPDEVVDAVAARGLGWIGEGLGPTPLADRVGGAVIAADPVQAQRRADRRRGRQNVTVTGCGDGLAGLRADLLDAADAAAMQGMVDAMAAAMAKSGDLRPVGQLRVEALKQLLTRPWETLPEDVGRACWQLRLQVDLADLDGLGPLGDPTGTAPADETPASPPDHSPAAPPEPTPASPQETTAASPPDPTPASPPEHGAGGSGVGAVGGLPVGPDAVAELLARYDALIATGPAGRVEGGSVWFEVLDSTGRLQAIASPAQARAAVRRGTGLGPPPQVQGYEPSAAQVRFVKARDQHCRFPGCTRPAQYTDLDHVIPRNHTDPATGGPTCITNLACLCRRHHRLKTHSPGWAFVMDPDGTLHTTPPSGRTRTTRPPGIAEVHVSARSQLDAFTDLFGHTPKRYRTPTPEERAERRATAAARASLTAEIEAELDAALARQAAETLAETLAETPTGTRRQAPSDQDPPPF